jgi:NAD dependent epimerase/dehydratase
MGEIAAGTRVLVTGADGFIGSHLVERLATRGAKVRALSLYNSFNDWGWLEQIDPALKVEVVTGDVRDKAQVSSITKDIDVVFHLASLIAIPYSYIAPESYVQTNVQGTLNVVLAAKERGVRRIVHTSTSEVYGTARKVPIGEDHPLQPQSPYSATKIAADSIAMSFHHAFGLPLLTARPFNTYGPRQSARAVIPTIITQLLEGKKRIKLGRVDPTRDFNFVTDTCEGMIALAECDGAVGKVVNIGSGSEISIGDLASLIGEILGATFEIETEPMRLRPEQSEVERLVCDNAQIRKLTGWCSQIGLREGLEKTVAWFRRSENMRRYKAGLYNL